MISAFGLNNQVGSRTNFFKKGIKTQLKPGSCFETHAQKVPYLCWVLPSSTVKVYII